MRVEEGVTSEDVLETVIHEAPWKEATIEDTERYKLI